MTDAIEKLHVDLGDRAYDILIGPRLIERAGAEDRALDAPAPSCRRFPTRTSPRHYLEALRDSLSTAGITHHALLLPPGEQTKDLEHFGRVAEEILGDRN